MARTLTPSGGSFSHNKSDLLTKMGAAKYSNSAKSSYGISSTSKSLAGSALSYAKVKSK
jgi:hypothetical protein